MAESNDWRLQGQEKYLKGVILIFKKYTQYSPDWDHDHCEFCSVKFMEEGNSDCHHYGYVTCNNYRWICTQCFEDFKEMIDWKI